MTTRDDRPCVLVFSERPDVSDRLLTRARQLADPAGMTVVALPADGELRTTAARAFRHGAGEVLVAPGTRPAGGAGGTSARLDLLTAAVREVRPAAVLIGATRPGTEITARLAQRLRVAAATECVQVDITGRGGTVALSVVRYLFGGRFLATQVLRARPALASVRTDALAAVAIGHPPTGLTGLRELRGWEAAPITREVRVVARARAQGSPVDLAKAPVVVAAGRGVRRREDLALLASLSAALGGELAGSRPLVDARWLPPDRLVGLSGRSVSPRLYLACGVSGQIEHVTGMRSARTVVAVNPDPDAPIHRVADYSLYADLYSTVPALTAAVLAHRRTC